MLENICKILITGGAGFIGSHLIDFLLRNGHYLLCIDDLNDFYDPAEKLNNIKQHQYNSRFKIIREDICSTDRMDRIFASYGPEIVVHLAARAGVRPSLQEPHLYAEVNIKGTLNILEASIKTGVKKFVFASSSSVYGLNTKIPFNEEDPLLTPISPYAATKIAGEALCHSYARLYGLPTVALRFFTVYGPRQRPDLAITKFARLIHEEQPLPLYGNGTTRRDYTYIDDIVAGILAAIGYKSALPYDVFNLGNAKTVELTHLIRLLEQTIGKKARITYLPAQPGDVPQTWADITKAERFLGFRPTTSIECGLTKFSKWLEPSLRLR